ncbi:ParB N-terminal domain-containing protein [Bradyrhizobium sp. CCGUVB14]|uniref:ParB/RepB/Spo0J family partition protein n=1 Tax=Bradyrhizobium sp. CCGUVB14 TaxID=2949628 RepID=UPI0020B35FE2|nr:ParB N-terminal domain-containing protein [Bradyrhizobium sp. CCGUVB14]MCP3439795.1 ParB N-terminal domain-containing protein [Bradyrhizobium sp. CCGUVB14]
MNKPEPTAPRVVGIQERPLGGTVLRTYRRKIDIDDVVPNPRQPRLGPKEDEELQRQIVDNKGIFEPLLVEPHPEIEGKFRIIDGERRWKNSKVLVDQGKSEFREIPIEVTDRVLSEEDRLRVWIYIHRQRKEWDAREKEMVAYRLIELVGRASAANILGISFRELDKLEEVFNLAKRFSEEGLKDLNASITWARELFGVSKKLLVPTVIDAVVDKVARKRITNSKDLRKLRAILPDPVAKANFLTHDGDIDSAMLRIGGKTQGESSGLSEDLTSVVESMKRVPWTALADMKKDPDILKKIDEAAALLKTLRNSIVSS